MTVQKPVLQCIVSGLNIFYKCFVQVKIMSVTCLKDQK